MNISTEFRQVRSLAYLANSLMGTRYIVDKQDVAIYGGVEFPKLFRRAFVEVALQQPFALVREEGNCTFHVYEKPLATVGRNGKLRFSKWFRHLSPIGLHPKNIEALSVHARDEFEKKLSYRYWVLVGPERHGDYLFNGFAGGYTRSRLRVLSGLAIRTIKEFCNELPQDRVRVLRRNYLTTRKFAHVASNVTSPRIGLRWCQALDAYPAMLYAYWSNNTPTTQGNCPRDLDHVISQGKPLVPALAEGLGISESGVRRFQGVTLQRAGMLRGKGWIKFITLLPQHLRPISRADFRAARTLYGFLFDMHGDFQDDLWHSSAESLVRSITKGMKVPLGEEKRIDELSGVMDMVFSLSTLARNTDWNKAPPSSNCATRLLGHEYDFGHNLARLSLGRLVNLNKAWHRTHREATRKAALYHANVMEQTKDQGWEGVVPGHQIEVGDRIAVELTTPAELLQEGYELGHCVGGYVASCYSGISRIVSLRSRVSPERYSTIEFQMIQTKLGAPPKLIIAQHLAHRNTKPSDSDIAAANALLRTLRLTAKDTWAYLDTPQVAADDHAARILNEAMTELFNQWFRAGVSLPESMAA